MNTAIIIIGVCAVIWSIGRVIHGAMRIHYDAALQGYTSTGVAKRLFDSDN